MLRRARERKTPWDMVIVGGGATGIGVAVDAATRGYGVLLLERDDFGKGTSSRSTKLVHGGVRYLGQGNFSLVMEALKERGLLRRNAPHLVADLAFVVPVYQWWESPFYGVGLKIYDLLAGRYGFGASKRLSKEETLERLPTLKPEGLRGGVVYYDGQFDDARLLVHLARTAADHGATLVNHAPVVGLSRDAGGLVDGVVARDLESGGELRAGARVVVNAAGAFCDGVRRLADPNAAPMIAPSQGVHLVFDRSFLPGDSAIMVPHTKDGRVLFAIPWHGRVVVGTTDTPVEEAAVEPCAFPHEVDFILETAANYLARPPRREDVLSVFTGIRPLVKAGEGSGKNTAALSRDHTIHIDPSGLLTIAGGKWTTYRNMAEDAVDQAATMAELAERPCVTRTLRIHGWREDVETLGHLAVHGADAEAVRAIGRGERLHERLPYTEAEVVFAARFEMARRVEDVLARRTRALPLDARAAVECAPKVAGILARELRRDAGWERDELAAFRETAGAYVLG